MERHFSTIFNIQKCNIFVVFSNSPDASEKVDLMLFLWSARLVRIYSLTSFLNTWKSKLCSFFELPAWWKCTHWPLLTKLEAFESSKPLKDSPHSCPPTHHGCANHGTGCRISFLGRLERHPTYHWKVLRFFSGNLHSQLFLITFCNLKLPSKSESSKIQQNHNISYRCIMCSPTHICWPCVD